MRSALCTALLLLSFPSPETGKGDIVEEYRRDPAGTHRRLKEAFLSGRPVGKEVRRLLRETGDYSFDSLLAEGPQARQALGQQLRALELWKQGQPQTALSLYQESVERLLELGMSSEAAFSLYYVAEIHAEQERYQESLVFLEQSLRLGRSRPRRHLEALVFQSSGYNLWYLDYLHDSVLAFNEALKRWREIDYAAGMVVIWNNLAILHEELELWERARGYYRQALEHAVEGVDEEILFPLYANLARFHRNRGEPSESLAYLGRAARWRSRFPDEFFLLQAEIRSSPGILEDLLHWSASSVSARIEGRLLASRIASEAGDKKLARELAREALEHSRREHLPFFTRKATLQLGTLLEKEGDFRGALNLYSSLQEGLFPSLPSSFLIPYSRKAVPFLDGTVRCLVRLGRWREALERIRQHTRQRREAARLLLSAGVRLAVPADEEDPFSRIVDWENRLRSSALPLDEESPTDSVGLDAPGWTPDCRFSLVELWPDEDRVYAWIEEWARQTFLELRLPRPVSVWVEELVGPLYQARDRLPPEPPRHLLRQLYDSLFRPLVPHLRFPSLLIVGHKELQSLPLEILVDEAGMALLHRYTFSYLPSALFPQRPIHPWPERPLLLLPALAEELEGVEKEARFLLRHFPGTQVRRGFKGSPLQGRWIHVSSHFRLDPRFWVGSGFEAGSGVVGVYDFLRYGLACRLLSLGTCDVASPHFTASPYQLGLCELLLSAGAEALLASRWRLDALSLDIYLDFYRFCRQGMSMDSALAAARRQFQGRTLQREGRQASGFHPFFWAGISYVGVPGRELFDRPRERPSFPPFLLALLLLLWAGVRLFRKGLRCSHSQEQEPAVSGLEGASQRKGRRNPFQVGLLEELQQDRRLRAGHRTCKRVL